MAPWCATAAPEGPRAGVLSLTASRRSGVSRRNAAPLVTVCRGRRQPADRRRSMATVALTTTNFDEVTSRDGIVLVDFWAGWCGPCLRFAPVYERASEKHTDLVFGKVDTEAEQA